jgi:uncharacterized protein YndB with AHSA1/START domain
VTKVVVPTRRLAAGMVFTCSRTIAAPIERVFDLIDDPEKLPLWMDGLEETVFVSRPARGESPVGARFRQRIREGGRSVEYDGEVTAYDKPTHVAVRIGGKNFSVVVDYRLAEVAGGTRLDYSADVTNRSLMARIMGVVAGGLNRRIAERQLTRLKTVAEGLV